VDQVNLNDQKEFAGYSNSEAVLRVEIGTSDRPYWNPPVAKHNHTAIAKY